MSLSYQNNSEASRLAKEYYDQLINPGVEKEKKEAILTKLEMLADSEEINCPEAKFYFYKFSMRLIQTNNDKHKQDKIIPSLRELIIFYLNNFKENYLANRYLLPITDYHNTVSEKDKYCYSAGRYVENPLYKTYLAFSDEMKLLIDSKIDKLLAKTRNKPGLQNLLDNLKKTTSLHRKKIIYDVVFNNFHHLIQGNYRYFSEKVGQILYLEKNQLDYSEETRESIKFFSILWFKRSNNYLMLARSWREGFIEKVHFNKQMKANNYEAANFYLKALMEGSSADKYFARVELKEMADSGSVDAAAVYGNYLVHELKEISMTSHFNEQELYRIAVDYTLRGANSILSNEKDRLFLTTSPYSTRENYFEIAEKLNLLNSEIERICRFEQTHLEVKNQAYKYLLDCLKVDILSIQNGTAVLRFSAEKKAIIDNICKLAEAGCSDAASFMGYYLYQNQNEFEGKKFHTQSVTPKGCFIFFDINNGNLIDPLKETEFYNKVLLKNNAYRIIGHNLSYNIEERIESMWQPYIYHHYSIYYKDSDSLVKVWRSSKDQIIYLTAAQFEESMWEFFFNSANFNSPPKLDGYDWFEKNHNYLMMAKCCREGLLTKVVHVENKTISVEKKLDHEEFSKEYIKEFITKTDWEGIPTIKEMVYEGRSNWDYESWTSITGKRRVGVKSYTYQHLPPHPQKAISLYLKTIAERPIQDKQAALVDLKEMAHEGLVDAQEAYQAGVRQILADLRHPSNLAASKIKYAVYLESIAYIESLMNTYLPPSYLFLVRFLAAYPFEEYDSSREIAYDSIGETLRACIQSRSRLKSFIVDLDNQEEKTKSFRPITHQHSKGVRLSDIQTSLNLDQLKLKAEKNDILALCQLVQHFADKRTRMEKFSSQTSLTANMGMFANREHSHFTAENYWLQLLYTMADHSLSPKERNEITLLAENGNATAKLILIFEVVCRESSSPREKLQAQSDLAQVMHWGGKVFDSVCEKINKDRSYVTPEVFAFLEKAGCFEDLSVSANAALPRLTA